MSSQIGTNSLYGIALTGIFLNFSLTFSNCIDLSTLFASFTLKPNSSSSAGRCSGGLSPLRRRRLSSVMFSDFSFSQSLSPTGRVRKAGRLEGGGVVVDGFELEEAAEETGGSNVWGVKELAVEVGFDNI
ncbi:Uncharacterized protein Fot_19680 [Forsythia ovata]|uniref:Uncharacterized protein n=1 Tax=Forsythia ovata TaxID=205694 RepID=A0ABD1VLQ6_9LAMI